MMWPENGDQERVRDNTLLLSKLAAATLIATLALAVAGTGCTPADDGDDAESASMSSAHVEAPVYTCSMHPNIALPEAGKCPICGVTLVPAATDSSEMSGAMPQHSHDAGNGEGEGEGDLYTCAMHPHIVLQDPGNCPICGMELIPVAAGSSDSDRGALRLSPYAAALARVETALVERKPVTIDLRLVGKLAYDETRVRTVSAWLPGRLDRLYVDYVGVTVKRGDHLGELYGPDLVASQQDLIEASRAARRARKSSSSLAEIAADTLDASRERFRLWGFSAEQIRQLEQRGQPSDHLTIYSPASGVVIERAVEEGSYVREGDTILRIADLSELWLVMAAYESQLSWLLVGQAVKFEVPALPGERFEGRIAFVSPVVDPATRTTQVRLNIANADGRLKPEMFVKARVQVHVREDGKVVEPSLVGKWIGPMHPEIVREEAGSCPICGMQLVQAKTLGYEPPGKPPLVIPATAALITGRRAIVYVADLAADGSTSYEAREIRLGPRAGDTYLVLDGLEEGESVVKQGAFKIDASTQIRAKPSMMNPRGGVASSNPHAQMGH
jgi:Cu(I)/Ag(I) efflux system membrane fusion protein